MKQKTFKIRKTIKIRDDYSVTVYLVQGSEVLTFDVYHEAEKLASLMNDNSDDNTTYYVH